MTRSTKETILGVAMAALVITVASLGLAWAYNLQEPASEPYLQPGDTVTWARVAYVRHNSVKFMLWGDNELYMDLEGIQSNTLVWRERVPLVYRKVSDPHGNSLRWHVWVRGWEDIDVLVYEDDLNIYDLQLKHEEW